MPELILGTRGSALALAQANSVKNRLEQKHPGLTCALKIISSKADEQPLKELSAFPGEGIFVKELEAALLERRIDCAVHSLKDVPLAIASGLQLTAILEREEARDALVSRSGVFFDALPQGAHIGTSSLRRQSQILCRRPDIRVSPVRGNVDTRLRKLDQGQFDAILLAGCGLKRLELHGRITEYLDPSWMVPEPGQGALAIESRRDDTQTNRMVAAIDHASTRGCVMAERAFLEALGGGCHLPIGALAVAELSQLRLSGAVVVPDGSRHLRGALAGDAADAVTLGKALAAQLLKQGAKELLQ